MKTSTLCASMLAIIGTLSCVPAMAWEMNKFRERDGDWSQTIGPRRINMNTWGWNKAGAGAWLHMHYDTNTNLKQWYLSYDLKNVSPENTYHVKAYPHIGQGWTWATDFTPNSGLPKLVDKNLKSKATFRATRDWASNDSLYNMMIETFGHENPRGGNPPAFEVMIWGDYQGSCGGQEVTVDGTKWSRDINWAHADGRGGFLQKIVRYCRLEKSRSFSANIVKFLENAEVGKRHNGTWRPVYLSHISTGFEIYKGNGGWNITESTIKP